MHVPRVSGGEPPSTEVQIDQGGVSSYPTLPSCSTPLRTDLSLYLEYAVIIKSRSQALFILHCQTAEWFPKTC